MRACRLTHQRIVSSTTEAGAELVSSGDEIAWAFRKQLEAVAAETPVVCVFDELHWGEETFLDLIEHVADLSRDAPILLLCMARPELLDRRTGWAGARSTRPACCSSRSRRRRPGS